MPSAISGSLNYRCGFDGQYIGSADIATPTQTFANAQVKYLFTAGTGADQANVTWADERSLVATAESLDVRGGALADAFGQTVNVQKLKYIRIENDAASTGVLLVGGASNVPLLNGVTDKVSIRPGGVFVLSAPDASGIAVTAGTGDLITVDSGAFTCTYRITLVGVAV